LQCTNYYPNCICLRNCRVANLRHGGPRDAS